MTTNAIQDSEPKDPGRRPGLQRSLVVLLVGGIVGMTCFLIWTAWFNNDIHFLDYRPPARWIVYPTSPVGMVVQEAEVTASFRRTFKLDEVPARALLALRAMTGCTATINGAPVEAAATSDRWKKPARTDVRTLLRPGTNEIVVYASNRTGPPAMWLLLEAGQKRVISDETWTTSLLGAPERNALAASTAFHIPKGSRLFAEEQPLPCLLRHLPVLLLFAVGVAAILLLGRWWLKSIGPRLSGQRGGRLSRQAAWGALAVAALFWLALYVNNVAKLPSLDGFDSTAHLDYIKHIRTQWTLPLADEGWQMYQPPLYYMASAVVLSLLDSGALSEAVGILRAFSLFIGIAHFALVFLCLRLLFPERWGMQWVGLLLAVAMPENLYISHYVTNESLAAMLVTGSIYFTLMILKGKDDSWRMFLGVGACLGAALLAKVTAVLAVPFIATSLLAAVFRRNKEDRSAWAVQLAGAGLVCVGVCGWHYQRVWQRFGSMLLGNWDPASGHHWWMEPGFHTASYFMRFGECLVQPWYSGMHGFWDGLYATLWGDGLFGGTVMRDCRPPWNFELMAAGYLLALVPTLLILAGAAVAIWRFFRKAEPEWFLLLGLAAATLGALAYMNMKIPTYGQAKAFYGLVAFLPLCAFGSLGWGFLRDRARVLVVPVTVLLGIWGCTVYASFWIRGQSAETHLRRGQLASREGQHGLALQEYAESARLDPQRIGSRQFQLVELCILNRVAEAPAVLDAARTHASDDGDSHFFIGIMHAALGQLDPAIAQVRRSIELAPDNVYAYDAITGWLVKVGRQDEAVAFGLRGLSVNPFWPELHLQLGKAFAALHDNSNAVARLRLAALLKPKLPQSMRELGIAFASLECWEDATNALGTALKLLSQDTVCRLEMARALTALGQDHKAIGQYREILRTQPGHTAALNRLAWVLATHPDAAVRNGAEAVALASRACEGSGWKEPDHLATLAAAYAETGRFEEASSTIGKALAEAGSQDASARFQQMQESYREHRPWRTGP